MEQTLNKIRSLYGITMLFRECKYYYNDNNDDLVNLYMEKKGKSFFHFNTKNDCDKFKLDCNHLFPKVKLGDNCCSGNGIEVCLNENIKNNKNIKINAYRFQFINFYFYLLLI